MLVFVHALVSEISVSASVAFSYLLALFGLSVPCLSCLRVYLRGPGHAPGHVAI